MLFADLVGFTGYAERLDPEDVWVFLAAYHARVRAVLERLGGTVEKFIGDAVMAVFGAPVARDDDAERAVRAAIAVRDAVTALASDHRDFDLRLRIGVNTGEALVAVDARPAEGEGIAFGDVVNTAARLQQAAPPNEILVGGGTYRATRRVIEYRTAEPIQARGKAHPVPVWVVHRALAPAAEAGAGPRAAGLVGRRDERRVLADSLARVRRHREARLVTIVGAPGIGKSRLVAELRGLAHAGSELHWWQGRSQPFRGGGSYQALTEMVTTNAGVLETDDAEAAGRKLATSVEDAGVEPADRAWLLSHLRPLLGLDRDPVRQGDQRAGTLAAWRCYFEALARQRPVVLVLEDLQWADDGQLDFVEHLLGRARGVGILVIATARPEFLDRRPQWGERENAVTVQVAPLSDAETASLISGLLGPVELTGDLRQALLERVGGNPLFAEEYVRMLLDHRPGGLWSKSDSDVDELPLPDSVQSVLAARLDALPAEQKQLVQDAAVVGEVFWLGAVEAVSGWPQPLVDEHIAALEAKEFVRQESPSAVGGDRQFVFTHALVREAAYAQIPRAERVDKHCRAGGWDESLAADRSEAHADRAAHHYLMALRLARAAGQDVGPIAARAHGALTDAADRAFALSEFKAAARLYLAALELCAPDARERPLLLLGYARSVFTADREGADVIAEARDLLLASGDHEGAAEAEMMLGELEWIANQWDRALTHFHHAEALVEVRRPTRSTVEVLASLARFNMIFGENQEALRHGRTAQAMARSLDLPALEASRADHHRAGSGGRRRPRWHRGHRGRGGARRVRELG